MDLLAETVVGPYVVRVPVGSGGMGDVYRAHDQRLDRDVALKIISAEFATHPTAVARFDREAKALAALSHPNIVTLFDYGVHGDLFYIVTELLEGETLRAHASSAALPWRRAVAIALKVADALRCAHEKGIVHRDLKPENIFITSSGLVKVLDFGLAHNAVPREGGSKTLTTPGVTLGTCGYSAPEQLCGEPAGPQSDIFSFGCVLYEMLSGKRAFSGRSGVETTVAVLKNDPDALRPLCPDAPEQLIRLVEHCLEKDPWLRFQSFADLMLALTDVEPSAAVEGAKDVHRLRAQIRSAAAAVLVVIVAAVIYVGWRMPGASTPRPEVQRTSVSAAASPSPQRTVVNAEAYRLYKQGRYEWDHRTPDALLKAIDFFRRSLEIDPTYAPAHLGVADCYMLLGGTYEYLPARDAMPKAREAALRALALDDSLAVAHATLANIHHEYDWNWPAAEREFKRAIELDPQQAVAHQWYGQALVLRGRHADGLRQLKIAEELDPLLFVAQTDFVQAFWIAGDNEAAITRAERVIEVEPRFWLTHWLLGLAQLSHGDVTEGVASLERAVQLGGTPAARGTLAAAYAQAGRREDARAVIRDLEKLRSSGVHYVSPAGFVVAHAALGDLDKAYEEAERGLRERASLITSLNSAPVAEPFRRDPRYVSFAQRVGLPPLPTPGGGR